MSDRWHLDSTGNAVAAKWDFARGLKQTMDGSAKSFGTLLNLAEAYVLITNTGSVTVYARGDGTAAVAAAKETIPIMANEKYEMAVVGGLSIIGASGDVFVMPAKR